MALAMAAEKVYGGRVSVTVSGSTKEYGTGNGTRAAALAKQLAKEQGAKKVRRRSHGIKWDGENFSENFLYLVIG